MPLVPPLLQVRGKVALVPLFVGKFTEIPKGFGLTGGKKTRLQRMRHCPLPLPQPPFSTQPVQGATFVGELAVHLSPNCTAAPEHGHRIHQGRATGRRRMRSRRLAQRPIYHSGRITVSARLSTYPSRDGRGPDRGHLRSTCKRVSGWRLDGFRPPRHSMFESAVPGHPT